MKHPMGPRRLGQLALVLASLTALPALAQPVGFMLEGSWLRTGPTGTVQLTGSYSPAPGAPPTGITTAIDLESDLGYGKKSVFPFGARYIGKRFRIEGEYYQEKDSSSATLTRDIVYQGIVYRAGDPVASDYRLRDVSGHGRFDLVATPYASVGLGVDVDWVRYEASITATTRGVTGSDSRNVLVPTGTVALSLHDAARHLWLDVKAGYISYQGSSAKKGRVEAGYGITENLGIKAGWRLFDVIYVKTRGSQPDDRIDLKLDGYYAGLFVSF